MEALPSVISVDSEKCVNCHMCIGVCPVKYCNDASDTSQGIRINDNLCIGCGACLRACTHSARRIVDDTKSFFEDLGHGKRIAVLVAPAVDASFPGQLGHLLGWLKHLKTAMVFDVSFGAEIATYQYVKAIRNGATTPIIAQPCPSVVTYLEIYKPHLLKYLAPTGSPAMDMARWVRQKYPDVALAFIGPCLAKKREFSDSNTKGIIQYNITLANLRQFMAENGIDLGKFSPIGFDGPLEAERALLYSQPGGMHETIKRYNLPLRTNQVRRVEGPLIYEEYFAELEEEIAQSRCDVILIDILNCQHGCNRGSGTLYEERTTDAILKHQTDRLEERTKEHYPDAAALAKLEEQLASMEGIEFSRQYTDRSSSFRELLEPSPEMIKVMHEEMGKFEAKDLENCGACGYHSCNNMAKAILNGLYRPQQCHHFLRKFYEEHSTNG